MTDLNDQGRLKQISSGLMSDQDSLQYLRYRTMPRFKTIRDVPNGNVLTIQDYLDKTGADPQTQTFTYDSLDRLTSARVELGTYGLYALQNYTYDASTGNLSSKAGVSYTTLASLGAGYADSNHKHAVTNAAGDSFSYDANGNQTTRNVSGSAYTLTYDQENRLTSVSGAATATFVYDGDGNRVKGTIGGTTTTYIGSHFEWTGSTSTMKKFYYAGATRVAMRTGSSTLNYLFGDHLGSTAITANSSGVRSAEIRYYPWGTERYVYGTTPTTYHFTGQRMEDYIKLYWYGSRWLDPYLNRWIQPDSIIPDPYNSQSYDRYTYAINNPVRYTDPSGHNWWDTVGQFASGFVNEFALRNVGWISPNGQRDLGASAYESDASIAGRLVADVATIILGVENVTTGAATMTGGTVVACGTTLCFGATVTVAGGAVLVAVGGSQVSQGAMGLGSNLALLSSNNRGGSVERSQREIRKSVSSLERNIEEHKATLQAYMEDPYAFDNQGLLRNAPNDEIRQSIINGRINHLQHEIDNWQQQLDYLNGLLNDN